MQSRRRLPSEARRGGAARTLRRNEASSCCSDRNFQLRQSQPAASSARCGREACSCCRFSTWRKLLFRTFALSCADGRVDDLRTGSRRRVVAVHARMLQCSDGQQRTGSRGLSGGGSTSESRLMRDRCGLQTACYSVLCSCYPLRCNQARAEMREVLLQKCCFATCLFAHSGEGWPAWKGDSRGVDELNSFPRSALAVGSRVNCFSHCPL